MFGGTHIVANKTLKYVHKFNRGTANDKWGHECINVKDSGSKFTVDDQRRTAERDLNTTNGLLEGCPHAGTMQFTNFGTAHVWKENHKFIPKGPLNQVDL